MGSKVEEVVRTVRGIAEEAARARGLEVVDVVFRPHGRHTLLRVDVDRAGPAGVRLEDCEQVSRDVERRLEDLDLIHGAYDLQVSSPGTERPIRSEDDYRRNTGRSVVVETRAPVLGETRFRGVLAGIENGSVRVVDRGGEEVRIPLNEVSSAKQDVEADLHSEGRRATGSRGRGTGVV